MPASGHTWHARLRTKSTATRPGFIDGSELSESAPPFRRGRGIVQRGLVSPPTIAGALEVLDYSASPLWRWPVVASNRTKPPAAKATAAPTRRRGAPHVASYSTTARARSTPTNWGPRTDASPWRHITDPNTRRVLRARAAGANRINTRPIVSRAAPPA